MITSNFTPSSVKIHIYSTNMAHIQCLHYYLVQHRLTELGLHATLCKGSLAICVKTFFLPVCNLVFMIKSDH